MPPHCDTMDGPVVTAARRALELNDVALALAYVPASGEAEVRAVFAKVQKARMIAPAAREVADLYFFETVVRVHRIGEGAPYTGLKPAGQDEGPMIRAAEKAIESGSPDVLLTALADALNEQVKHRFANMMALKDHDPHDIAQARAYVEAKLGLQVYAHTLYNAMKSDGHDGHLHHSIG